MLAKSSSLQTPFTWPEEYLIQYPTYIRPNQLQYLENSESFSKKPVAIPLIFGIV